MHIARIACVAFALTAALAAGCEGPTSQAPEDFTFPPSFQFGTATAGFQVEMGCPTIGAAECEDKNSDWYTWVTRPELIADTGLYLSGDAPSKGPGFYELYATDLDRIKGELHGNALRVGIEWSRVFPAATFAVTGYDALKQAANPAALAFYHALFAAMKARGIKPFVTLNHYVLPGWLHDAYGCHVDLDTCTARGWLDHDRILAEMAKYAGFVAQEFGGEVDQWATLNEPFTAVIITAYLFQTAARTNPPGVSLRIPEAKAAFSTMIEAHARMYDAVHAADLVDADGDGTAARVGIVYNLQASTPYNSDDPRDQLAATNFNYLINQAFLDGVGKGDLDAALDGHPTHRDDLANRLDFLGINYYARATTSGAPGSFFPTLSPLLTFNPISLPLDYAYPRGIYEVITWAKRYGVPMVISETGVEDSRDTGAASAWVVDTLAWVKRAMTEGAPVEGYYYWTLMDNYEWNHGMNIKMGLYAVDPADPTKRRTARSAVATYGRIASAGAIPSDLAATVPAKD